MIAPHPTLLIRADANEISGTGHLMRCLALAQAWQRAQGKAVFLSRSLSPALENRIIGDGFELSRIDTEKSDYSESKLLMERLEKFNPDWVVLDGYHFSVQHHDLIRRCGHRLLVIDDYNHLDRYQADILLNQNLRAEKIHYQCPGTCTRLLGADYVMLRNEFLDQPKRPYNYPEKASNILITMGGADPFNVTSLVIKALNFIDDASLNVNLIIGPANLHRSSLEKEANASSFNAHVLHAAANMPELMQSSNIAVSAGGSTAWELAFLGVPAICIIIADNQKGIVREISRAGAGVNAGWHEDILPEQLSKTIMTLIVDKKKRKLLSESGTRLISGNGADRVVSKMIERSNSTFK